MAAPAKFLFDMDFGAPDKTRERAATPAEIAAKIADACILGQKVWKETARTRGAREEDPGERVIHVSSGGDGPRVEMSTGRHYDPEASASPETE